MASTANMKYTLKARVREFGVPPIHDVLVLGKQSHIGCAAIRKAIEYLVASPFDHLEFEDDVISDIIVRSAILRRIPKDKLIAFISIPDQDAHGRRRNPASRPGGRGGD
ncbi:MAG TPA: hypothetical protein VJ437_04845 [Acidiferrobacterales bacterium]|nr:hypothetical protein [Acidiferrobacterales bacterium]